MSPETLQTLRSVLGPLLEADAKPKHCVRCHKTFREEKNTRKSCVVLCGDEYRMTPHVDEEYDCYNMVEFNCCGQLRSEGELEDDEELVCYTAEHTVDPEMVKYFVRDSWDKATKEKGINYVSWNPNVHTCKMTGCGKGKPKKPILPRQLRTPSKLLNSLSILRHGNWLWAEDEAPLNTCQWQQFPGFLFQRYEGSPNL
ncbi:hypothetical protein FRC10_005878 [Ceratobasidium sp. 414]|nr:hypothetical protein FRC10_005878 [Ceratobasidium sp. 414]